MKRIAIIMVTFSMILTACGQNYSGDNQQIETTDMNYKQLNNPGPVTYNQSGETTNESADRQTIKQAAERVPRVQVESVEFEGVDATVTVAVNERLTESERKAWAENIKSAIEANIYKYQIKVIVKNGS